MVNSVSTVKNYSFSTTQEKAIGHQGFSLNSKLSGLKHNQNKQVSFTAKPDGLGMYHYPSGTYWEDDIKTAEKYLDVDDWESKLYKETKRKPQGILEGERIDERIVGLVVSVGVFEILHWGSKLIDVYNVNREALEYVKRIGLLRNDILAERYNEQIAKAENINQEALNKSKLEQEKVDIKEKQSKPKFCDLIQMEKEGKPVTIPNCIMIEGIGAGPEVTRELIEWIGKNSKCRFVQINHNDGLLDKLEEAEENYQETTDEDKGIRGERTLIHVDGLEQQLNPKLSPFHVIEGLKDIMTSCSKDYHSTIIFSTTDPSKLDQKALQPYRVQRIKNIENPAEMRFEAAKTLLIEELDS